MLYLPFKFKLKHVLTEEIFAFGGILRGAFLITRVLGIFFSNEDLLLPGSLNSLPDSSSGVSSRMWVRIPAVTLVSLSKTLNHNCFSPPRVKWVPVRAELAD